MTKSPHPAKAIRVFVAYEHRGLLHGLREMLASCPDIDVIGTAESCREAPEGVQALRPDLVVLGCSTPIQRCLDDLREMRRRVPDARVIALSLDPDLEPEASAAGADRFMVIGSAPERLIELIRSEVEVWRTRCK